MRKHSPTPGARKGFTLIELLIVIGIIGFLAAAVLVAVDPVKRIQDARDARQFAEVNAILNAILNKQVDDRQIYNGSAGAPIIENNTDNDVQVITGKATDIAATACDSAGTKPICGAASGGPSGAIAYTNTGTGRNCTANLNSLTPTYIATIPISPSARWGTITGPALSDLNTGYFIKRTTGNRIEIGSCWPEQSAPISVKR